MTDPIELPNAKKVPVTFEHAISGMRYSQPPADGKIGAVIVGVERFVSFDRVHHKIRPHRGDPCRYCNTPHDEVESGPCPVQRRQLQDRLDRIAQIIETAEERLLTFGEWKELYAAAKGSKANGKEDSEKIDETRTS